MHDDESFDFSAASHEIYSTYLDTIKQLLITVEVATGQFPVSILNEIRAIFTHLARANRDQFTNIESAEDNCIKAYRHVKRAILDCYKILCIEYDAQSCSFDEEYEEVNLGLVDNGSFYPRYLGLQQEARDAFIRAKSLESEGIAEEDEIFDSYKRAYAKYDDLHDYIVDEENLKKLSFAKQMTDRNAELTRQIASQMEKNKKSSRFNTVLGITSIVLALVSIIEAFVIGSIA